VEVDKIIPCLTLPLLGEIMLVVGTVKKKEKKREVILIIWF